MFDFDVLYIGSGHATYDGAIPLSKSGKRVAVIEEDLIGGTCPNFGCDAKIILDSPTVLKHRVEQIPNLITGDLEINWPANIEHKDDIIGGNPQLIEEMMKSAGITIFHGHAHFKNAHTLEVSNEEVTADKIVIATGQRPHKLEIEGKEFTHDSREFLSLKKLPKRITILGGGYIALELATIAHESGAEVTIVMRGEKALRKFHQPFVEKLLTSLQKTGVRLITNANIDKVEQSGTHFSLITDDTQIETDWILDATGRVPNIDNLGLDKLNLEITSSGILVNEYLQTSIENIYAAGDVIAKSQPKLTPTAIFESQYLADRFAGINSDAIDYPVIPTVVFTSPRLAQVGVTYDAASAEPDKYDIVKTNLSQNWYRRIGQDILAENIIIRDKAGKIVGFTEVSDDADNSVNTVLPAIEFRMTGKELRRLIYAFPSISAAVKSQL